MVEVGVIVVEVVVVVLGDGDRDDCVGSKFGVVVSVVLVVVLSFSIKTSSLLTLL